MPCASTSHVRTWTSNERDGNNANGVSDKAQNNNHSVQLHSILPFNSSISWRCCRLCLPSSLLLSLSLTLSRRPRLGNLLYRQVFFCTHVFERWTFSVWLFKALKSLSMDTVTLYWIAETGEMEKRAIVCVCMANERVSEWTLSEQKQRRDKVRKTTSLRE